MNIFVLCFETRSESYADINNVLMEILENTVNVGSRQNL